MKKWAEVALGVVTGIGGFLEVGSIATASQAGAEFGFRLAWAIALGTIGLAFLMEMTGRLAAVSGRTYVDLLRERFGFPFFALPLFAVLIVSMLVLSAEIGGVANALEMASGWSLRWFAIPVALVGWLLLWRGTFSIVEQGTAMLGLVTIAFAVAAVKLHPQWSSVAHSLLPSTPDDHPARYWYLALSILGASISPYLYLFYSAGAIEDGWTPEYIGVNRVTALLGNIFGGGLSVATLVCAAMVFAPRHIRVEKFEQMGMLLSTPLGHAGLVLFIAALSITCFGATVEVTLATAYLLAQGFGWAWSENLKPGQDARFSTTYTLAIILAAVPIAAGVDPLALTNISMALTAASLPLTVIPLLVLMNDGQVMRRFTNGVVTNTALIIIAVISLVLLAAAIPLQVMGSG